MPCGEWSCYTTYNRIDKAFVGNISVVADMMDWAKKRFNGEIIWTEPVIHHKEIISKYKFRMPCIDEECRRRV